ncbi:hypothetical protein [Deinococcus misasensis]|uniref:hypothetical protein n=1 Tax=Deinococcus misasensis TaxID=392413 RepID=UPI000A84BB15|nr:hypothetical protein [Deinococcus misasensis]
MDEIVAIILPALLVTVAVGGVFLYMQGGPQAFESLFGKRKKARKRRKRRRTSVHQHRPQHVASSELSTPAVERSLEEVRR